MRTLPILLLSAVLACAPQVRLRVVPGVVGGAGGGGGGGTGGLITASNLTWQGAFKLPCTPSCSVSDFNSFHYAWQGLGQQAISYDPSGNSGSGSLLIGGFSQQTYAEVSIPSVTTTTNVGAMPTATMISGGGATFTNPCSGHNADVGSGSVDLAGLMRVGSTLYSNWYLQYDGTGSVTKYQCVSNATGTYVSGPWTAGALTGICTICAGHQAGWMDPVPSAWQASFGTSYIEGLCCISIVTRTSYGPSVIAWDPTLDGVTDPNPAVALLDYSTAHPTLGDWNSSGNLFNNASTYAGIGVIDNAVVFVGMLGVGTFCYGEGTSNPALAGTPPPDDPAGVYCYDTHGNGKGAHAYPYQSEILFYKASDLAAVHNATKNPWEPLPYSTAKLTYPAGLDDGWGTSGGAWDSLNRRLFLIQFNGANDGARSPLVNIYTVSTAPAPAPLTLRSLLERAWTK